MVKEQEIVCLRAVDNILSQEFDKGCYSTQGAKESAICIEKDGEAWIVYGYERGNKFSLSVFTNIVDACEYLIKRVAINYDFEKLINRFFTAIVRMPEE